MKDKHYLLSFWLAWLAIEVDHLAVGRLVKKFKSLYKEAMPP